jgi:hypothetical protein
MKMRIRRNSIVLSCFLGGVAFLGSGCLDALGDFYLPLTDPKLAAGGASGTGGTSGTSGTGGTGGTGGTPVVCIPSESKDPVADSCGVFVSSSLGVDDAAADRGTQAKPFKTIGTALMKADGARVYACAESFNEAVTISAAVDLYGGLDCKSWAYVGTTKKTKLTAAADAIPLTLSTDAGSVIVEDFAITAADAKTDGGSSIAVIADQVSASFARCDLVAGSGMAGLAGTTPTDSVGPTNSTDAAIKGNDGKNACMDPSKQFGGDAKENALCPAMSGGPLGGQGGVGAVNSGSNGDANPATTQTALGGQGEPTADPMWSCVIGGGVAGTNGASGVAGEGATGASSLGTLDKSGLTGIPGQPGGLAPPGQGGGGGGGAKGKISCAGASGGGGGAGGCGGKGGFGGKAGGASIALASLGATLSFDKVTIRVGVGGAGGNGGDGQVGGSGGKGGTGGAGSGTLDACDGGKGGQGGTGGKGGGGRGGHAIGIASTGAALPSTKGVTFTKGTPGKGGTGAADMMHDGDPGVQADVQVFP